MTNIRDNAIYLVVSLIILFFMWSIKPTYDITPQGIYLPYASPQKATDPKAIKLYQHTPTNAKTLGTVRAQYHLEADESEGVDAITDFAINKAAAVGADGLVINFIGHSQSPEYPALSGFQLKATAITLPRQ